jgi:Arc/MetJ-type ribon-helix-helix transcriptional regulator
MAEQSVQVERAPYAGSVDATRPRRVKITVRLSPERLERARKAVRKGYAPSISAWVEEAVRRHDSSYGWAESWEEAFAEWVREYGPFTDEELACARREVFGP